MAKIKIFFQDLIGYKKTEIVEKLKTELKQEIDELAESGTPLYQAEIEIIDNYINTHNSGTMFDI